MQVGRQASSPVWTLVFAILTTAAATSGAAAEAKVAQSDAVQRLSAAQRIAIVEFPGLKAEVAQLAADGASVRREAVSGSPYVEWQSEGLGGGDRQPNAADYVRIGTPFNLPGQIGKAKDLVRTADSWVGTGEGAASLATAAEVSRRWIDVAAALEAEALSEARLERLDEALNLQEARFQLGEIAGTEVRQLDLEYVGESSRLAGLHGRVEAAWAALAELCGRDAVTVRRGDLEALAAVSRTPNGDDLVGEQLAQGPILRRAEGHAELERSTAALLSATAWGRAEVEAEWERIPRVDGMPGFDAWGFRFTLPIPLGAAGQRQREHARARSAAADASLDLARREVDRSAAQALAAAGSAADRLRALEPALVDLPKNADSLAGQFRLGAISYLAYIDGLTRFDRIVEESIDARQSLLAARLELALLLGDPTVFPLPITPADEEN